MNCLFEAKSAPSTYLVMGGLFTGLAVWAMWVQLLNASADSWKGAAVSVFMAVAWTIWARGFRIRITASTLEYRDGLYRVHAIPRSDVSGFEAEWITWPIFGSAITVPRMVVKTFGKEIAIIINPKPFRRDAMAKVRALLGK